MSARRFFIALAAAALALLGVDWFGGQLVASAIAHAPNSDRALSISGSRPSQPPPDAERLVVPVGPPAAALDAWIVEPTTRPVKGTVILLHGIRMDKSSLLGFARHFGNAGYRSVLLDLRGHGSSSGTYLTYGVVEARDIMQLLDTLQRRYSETQFTLFGYSYGGAVAIQTAARDPRIEAVVAVSAFASLRRAVSDYQQRFLPVLDPVLPAWWLQARLDEAGQRAEFDPDEADPARAAATVRAPLLLIHGARDTQIPPSHARALSEKASHATLVLLEGETHESMLHAAASRIEDLALTFLERAKLRN